MAAMRKTGRSQAAQRVAEDAWERLVAATENAGDAARVVQRRTYQMADGAGTSVTSAADEARRRAGAAMDALAGRRPRMHWEWVAGAMVAGLVVGWAASAVGARRCVGRARTAATTADVDPLDVVTNPEY